MSTLLFDCMNYDTGAGSGQYQTRVTLHDIASYDIKYQSSELLNLICAIAPFEIKAQSGMLLKMIQRLDPAEIRNQSHELLSIIGEKEIQDYFDLPSGLR